MSVCVFFKKTRRIFTKTLTFSPLGKRFRLGSTKIFTFPYFYFLYFIIFESFTIRMCLHFLKAVSIKKK